MNEVAKLLAIEEIKSLRAAWSRLADAHQWAELEDLLAPDAELDLSSTHRLEGNQQVIRGARTICRWLEANVGRQKEQLHIVTMPEITFHSATDAHGIWRQMSFIGSEAGRAGKCGLTFGTVRDTYQKIEHRWVMRTIRIDIALIT